MWWITGILWTVWIIVVATGAEIGVQTRGLFGVAAIMLLISIAWSSAQSQDDTTLGQQLK